MTVFSTSGRPLHVAGNYDQVRSDPSGFRFFLNGSLHRENGPALITADGSFHFLHGVPVLGPPGDPATTGAAIG